VKGIHLVGPGGKEFFIQRGGINAIVDVFALKQAMPCVAGRVISNDDVFNAVLIGLGRFGIIYSLVLEVVPQYLLLETRVKTTWEDVGNLDAINKLKHNGSHFLQIVIAPYQDGGNFPCYVTQRTDGFESSASPSDDSGGPFALFCELTPAEKLAAIAEFISSVPESSTLLSAAVSAIPFFGPILAPLVVTADAAAATLLTPLLLPTLTVGDWLATLENILPQIHDGQVLQKLGLLPLAQAIVNSTLETGQSPHVVNDLSFRVMDTYTYNTDNTQNCLRVWSLEVGFDADQTAFLDFVADVQGIIATFANQNKIFGGYISVRFCGQTQALLGIEKFEHNAVIEVTGLRGLNGSADMFAQFHAAALLRRGILHWGQMNTCNRSDIENAFPIKINLWRDALARLGGMSATFDNDYCQQRGLEPQLADSRKHSDIAYLDLLLLQ
jgi:hypothetical protein